MAMIFALKELKEQGQLDVNAVLLMEVRACPARVRRAFVIDTHTHTHRYTDAYSLLHTHQYTHTHTEIHTLS